jgi:nucleoside-diphosphate-sugar epimerase
VGIVKLLFIGGTGNISTAVSRRLLAAGHELWLLNRGLRSAGLPGARTIIADIHQPTEVRAALGGEKFDTVVNWIAFTPEDVQRDLGLFTGRTGQYVFISSASVYRKPILDPVLTEATPAHNPFWPYSQNKIACEELLLKAWRENGFPATIVRPAHTYDQIIPVALSAGNSWTIVDRIRCGLPVVVHGDGTSIWVVTHSEDFAKGFTGLLGNARAVGEIFHITSDELLTWNQIHEEIGRAVGKAPKIVHIASDFIAQREPDQAGGLLGDKAHSFWCDNSKIKRFVPGYTATIPFHEGIRRTIAWFDADPARSVTEPATHALHERLVAAYLSGRP